MFYVIMTNIPPSVALRQLFKDDYGSYQACIYNFWPTVLQKQSNFGSTCKQFLRTYNFLLSVKVIIVFADLNGVVSANSSKPQKIGTVRKVKLDFRLDR